MRSTTKLLGAAAVSAALLALPAAAGAASVHGTALQVDRGHHALRLVTADHQVHSYRYGRVPAALRAGATVVVRLEHGAATRVAVTGHARQVRFHGRVLRRDGAAVVLRLADGQTFAVRAGDAREDALRAGRDDLVTLQLGDDGHQHGAALDPAAGDQPNQDDDDDDAPAADEQRRAEGDVVALETTGPACSLTLRHDGDDATFSAACELTAGVQVGDEVELSFHLDGDRQVADSLEGRHEDAGHDDHGDHGDDHGDHGGGGDDRGHGGGDDSGGQSGGHG